MSNSSVIGFVGMTHLGINYLAASSEKKFKVIGFDINKFKVEKLKKFKLDNSEPNLLNLIKKKQKKY